MAVIRGRYISLPTSTDRRARLEQHLQDLGVSAMYGWFPAVRGDTEGAKARGLGPGEWGLWQSWIHLLDEELINQDTEYDWLHITEDDVELSNPFQIFCQRLKSSKPQYELLFTDMYVNPSIYRLLAQQHQNLQKGKKVEFKQDAYTGCTASVLVHKESIRKLLNCLEDCVSQTRPLLPLDNQLRRLIHERKLSFARTAPFLTSVQKNSITKSTIQEPEKDDHSIVLTQRICINLRRKLSMIETAKTSCELVQLIEELAQSRTKEINFSQIITQQIIQLAETHDLLRYKSHDRIKGEPDYPNR